MDDEQVQRNQRCVVGNAECKGSVWRVGPTHLCSAHSVAWTEADAAGITNRMREWVRSERAKGAGAKATGEAA